MPPGHPPKRPKIDPNRSQDATFSLLNFDLVLGSILAPFWLPKCLPLGTLWATKIDQKNDQTFDCSKCRLSPQDRPRPPQDPPKSAPRPPKTTPRPPKSSLRDPQDPPKCPQEPPRSPQDSPRCSQETQKSPQDTVTYLLDGFVCIMHE